MFGGMNIIISFEFWTLELCKTSTQHLMFLGIVRHEILDVATVVEHIDTDRICKAGDFTVFVSNKERVTHTSRPGDV